MMKTYKDSPFKKIIFVLETLVFGLLFLVPPSLQGQETEFKYPENPTRTAYVFLFLGIGLFLLMLFFVVKRLARKRKQEKQKIARIIERTKELEEKIDEIQARNLQLEEQTAVLKDQSEKLKEMDEVKSRFFANISHEFRTPLTLIMGPLEQMLSESRDQGQEEKLKVMLQNSQRLLTLINQLLDLSRFDSGKMKLQAASRS
jgi:signal transduction histidine kinase